MYEPLLETLGLPKNEAKIYETLLIEGESSVGHIADKSLVHRRNVYDSLKRLVEKGLVFEIIDSKENHYQAVDPKKLAEIIEEKQTALNSAMPDLEKLFTGKPATEAVTIYKGLEGWKNYMRDILRIGQDDYIIGAKGVWSDPKIKPFTEQFAKQALKKGIKFHVLFDAGTEEKAKPLTSMLNAEFKFLPKNFETSTSIEIFGDHTIFLADCKEGKLNDNLSISIIINQQIANSFRTWFKLLWTISKTK